MYLNSEGEKKKPVSWLDFFLEILPDLLDALVDILSSIDFGDLGGGH